MRFQRVRAGHCIFILGKKVVRQNIGMHALSIAIVISALVLLPISATHNATALVQTEYWPKALLIALLATTIPYALDLHGFETFK